MQHITRPEGTPIPHTSDSFPAQQAKLGQLHMKHKKDKKNKKNCYNDLFSRPTLLNRTNRDDEAS
jgi:hypothetical protein